MALDWVEIALDYRCNLRCIGCRACHDSGERLTSRDVLEILTEARATGIAQLWIGGGEPTLREDLFAIIANARAKGFVRVLLQTNGLRIAYPKYADALVTAGVTDVSFNVKTHRAELNDRLTACKGSYALLVDGVRNIVARGIRAHADILLTRSTAPDLEQTIRTFAELGVGDFMLWVLSHSDDPSVAAEVPRLSDLREPIDRAGSLGVRVRSLHTPPCTLTEATRGLYFPARELRLRVVDPGRHAFPLESSPLEGGVYAEGCTQCASRASCGGARREYLEKHGADELIPL
jgi:MoaA/NifB/PqqE/SkfB family radical SAM enzyme